MITVSYDGVVLHWYPKTQAEHDALVEMLNARLGLPEQEGATLT